MNPFPLEQWFDLSKRVPKEDVRQCEAQMFAAVFKDKVDPYGPKARWEVREMKRAIKAHNQKFDD